MDSYEIEYHPVSIITSKVDKKPINIHIYE